MSVYVGNRHALGAFPGLLEVIESLRLEERRLHYKSKWTILRISKTNLEYTPVNNYLRLLNIDLPPKQSAWLWGARKTGKTTYLKGRFPNSPVFDLLDTDLFLAYEKRPGLFREHVLALPETKREEIIIVDEAQKVPLLLDEIHYLIESAGLQFLICGSSARKLKRGHANLLGGRAWRYEMHPLVTREIPDFDLLRALKSGLIASHYLSPDPRRSLKAYTADYLNEEIRAEALVRNLPAFSKFLEAAGFSSCEIINYSNIARDVGVDSKTVKEYFQILIDTHVGHLIEPFRKSRSRQVISSAPKFYFFDVGLGNYLAGRDFLDLKGTEAGKAFENFLLMELVAYHSYHNTETPIRYWRTKTRLEVDFVLGLNDSVVGIESKISSRIDKADLRGLVAFGEETQAKRLIVVCLERQRRVILDGNYKIEIIPWKNFLDDLWDHKM